MPIHLRQICLVAEKLAPAIDDLTGVFGVKPCFIDPQVGEWGLENTLLPIGTDFLEVVAPTRDGTPAGRYLDRRRGDGGYMVICQVSGRDEQEACRQRAADNGVRVAFEHGGEGWNYMQLHPGDMRCAFLSIDWDAQQDVTGNWHPAGGTAWKPAVSTDVVTAMTGVELQSDDPLALAEHWSAVTGIPVQLRDGAPVVALANADLRFVAATDGRGPGLGGLDLRVADKAALLAAAKQRDCYVSDAQVMVCGTRFNIVA